MKEFIEKLIERLQTEVNYNDGAEIGAKQAIEIVNQLAEEYNNGWIPVDMEVPPNDKYIMVSFDNFSLLDIARYEEDSEGGAFYPGDEEKSYASFGLFVNAWRPLPDPFKPGGNA